MTFVMCPHERQVYFDQTLPCARPSCVGFVALANVGVDRQVFDWSEVRRSVVRVSFHTDGERWIPDRCIDRHVDSNLTEKLVAAGLEGAFVS